MARWNSYMLPTPESHHPSNPPNSNPRRHLGRTMLAPTENTVFSRNMRLPNPHPANSGAVHGQYHYPLSAASSSQSLPHPTQYVPYRYDQRAYVNGANMAYPQEEISRVSFKRKHPHPAYHNEHEYCSNGSNLQPIRMSIATNHPSNFLSVGEQYQRNVRSRHGDTSFNPSWQSSSNPSHQLHTSVNNSSSNVVGQWGLPPIPGTHLHFIHPTGAGFSSFVMNRPVAVNVITAANTNNHGAYYSEQCRNQHSVLPTSNDPATRGTVAGPSRYNHRQISASVFKDSVPSVTGSIAFSRNPRPLIRNGGLRISNEAQPLFDEENERVRWTSQGSAMIGVPSYFNTLDLFDEYMDLRLDIDDMSYEELLALEDRIGNVKIGLSEDHLSLCLTKTKYCSSTPALKDQFESSCPICLEEYKDKDNIGMMKCLHAFHVTCIKDWLRIKNACPICKSPALEDVL